MVIPGEVAEDPYAGLRAFCHGTPPLPARMEPWQAQALATPQTLEVLLDHHDSPVNLIDPRSLSRNAAELVRAGDAMGVDTRVFYARKANKALALVDAAVVAGHGIDVASEGELAQVLHRGIDPRSIIVTAAIKPRKLLRLARDSGVTVSIDNLDELALLREIASDHPGETRVALRCAPEIFGISPSRFGLTADQVLYILDQSWEGLRLTGFHLHLTGYDHRERAVILDEVIELAAAARRAGHHPDFIDIGGGVPMRYLESATPWVRFWDDHQARIAADSPTTFWSGTGLGLRREADGSVTGQPTVYPMWQDLVRGPWLTALLDHPSRERQTLAGRLRSHGLALHLEPGRSILDGCGLTVARVESRKRGTDGHWYVGLAMNRTQCRSAAEDFLLDPIVVPTGAGERGRPFAGYLVGAYCIEGDLITQRRLRFPRGVAVGDLVAFVNTAGYLMHILESASHQIPLARNLIASPDGWQLDDIDRSSDRCGGGGT